MKLSKKLLLLLICAIMAVGSVAVDCENFSNLINVYNIKASAAIVSNYKTGDIIEFGWYPQSRITNIDIISALNNLAGDNKDWMSYNYYSGSDTLTDGKMVPSDYMRYKDVDYRSDKYRGVFFDNYRQQNKVTLVSDNCQKENGYTAGMVYWFKYEPIKWRVLDPTTGMVMSETVLDAQAYNNYLLEENIPDPYHEPTCWGDSSKTYYANNYEKSSIREWLNTDFYNTAFSTSQQDIIEYTELDNSAYSTSLSAYNFETTNDKIYLLSYSEALNSHFGFSLNVDDDTARQAKGSDYAECQGLGAAEGVCSWRLRTPGVNSGAAYRVDSDGMVYDRYCYTVSTDYGVRPALNLNLKTDIIQTNITASESTPAEDDEFHSSKSNYLWLLIIAIVILLMIIAGVLFAFLENKKKNMSNDMSFNESKTTDSYFNELNQGGICQECNKEVDKLWISTITTDDKPCSYLLCDTCVSKYRNTLKEIDLSVFQETNEIISEHRQKHSLFGKKEIIIICITIGLCAVIIAGAIGLRNHLSFDKENMNNGNITEANSNITEANSCVDDSDMEMNNETESETTINAYDNSGTEIFVDEETVKNTNSVKNEKKYLPTDYRNFGFSEAQIIDFAYLKYSTSYNMYDESENRKKADKIVREFLSNTSNSYYANQTPVFLYSSAVFHETDYVYSAEEFINEYLSTGKDPCCEGFYIDVDEGIVWGAVLSGSSAYILWTHGNDTSYWEKKATALFESSFPEYSGKVSDISLSEDEILVNTYDEKSFITDYDLDYIEEVEYREIYM